MRSNKIIPGVYTNEIAFEREPVRSIGATTLGLVGETQIGPAFQPIAIDTYKKFVNYFGDVNPETFSNNFLKYELPYIAKSYLNESNQLYVTRVLGLSGYDAGVTWELKVNGNYIGSLRSNAEYNGDVLKFKIVDITINGDKIEIEPESGDPYEYEFSLDKASSNYIAKLFPRGYNKNFDLYLNEFYESNIVEGGTLTIGKVTGTTNYDYETSFSSAMTPWFVSELKGSRVLPLFRFYTISDGDNANRIIKVSIANIDETNKTFDVLVRALGDNDLKPTILERFSNCSIDQNDGKNYIGYKIGTIDGMYKQRSKYIIVDVNYNETVVGSIPMGFAGYPTRDKSVNPIYKEEYLDDGSTSERKYYLGITDKSYDLYNFKGLNPEYYTKGFHIENVDGIEFELEDGKTCEFISATEIPTEKRLMKFTTYFYGGFDGWDIFREKRTNTNEFNYYRIRGSSNSVVGEFNGNEFESRYGIPNVTSTMALNNDFYAYWSAIRTFADGEVIDINLLATPGIDLKHNSILVNEVIEMVEEERKDCLYIPTLPDKANDESNHSKSNMLDVNELIGYVEGIDSSYTATYYPWIQYHDKQNDAFVYLPPTKDVVRNMAFTDNTTHPWFAPAGIKRGHVDCEKTKKNILTEEGELLINNNINIIKTFAVDGIKIWGQKTLQKIDIPINRIDVRRMMLHIKKVVANSSLPLIFEPGDDTTKTRFLEIVNPILNNVKNNRGMSEFKIIIDDSDEAKARHEMPVQIGIKPIGALEFIPIDFMISDEGFND